MFCTACGKENKDGYKFCIACGKELKAPASKATPQKPAPKHAVGNKPVAPAPEPVATAAPAPAPAPAPAKTEAPKPEPAKQEEPKRVLNLFDNKGNVCKLTSFPAVIGKSKTADCVLQGDTNVSREHVKIHVYGQDKFVCEDLNSTNKTFINGYILEPEELVILENDDVLMLGKTELKIQY